MQYNNDVYIWTAARFSLGGIFIWAFFDKLFGLGFATPTDKAWIHGVSPTAQFLKFGVSGPFSNTYHALTGSLIVDLLFMMGLLGIGVGLIFGIATKIASWSGVVMMLLIWLALLPPKNNPLLDEHIIYMIILIGIATTDVRSEDYFGLGRYWKNNSLVKKYSILE